MKKLLSILGAVILTTTGASSVVACKKPEIKNKKVDETKPTPVDKTTANEETKSTKEPTAKATDQQFADEIAKIINKKKEIIILNDDSKKHDEIIKTLNGFIKEMKIDKFDTSKFDKTKITFENIDMFYTPSENELKDIIIKYNNIKSKTKINLIFIKKDENDLSKMLNTNFGEIKLKNNIPSKTELVNYIKNKNINFTKITENDFEFKGTPSAINATIQGKGNFKGEVTLSYKRLLINLNNKIIGNSQNISLNSDFFNRQKVNVSSIQKEEIKKLVINYLVEKYGMFLINFILPDINLEKDTEIDFNNNIFPFDLKGKKEIKFNLIGINKAKGKIEVTISYSN